MALHGLATALTLYDSGTLTLSQAASRAGIGETEFIAQLERRGIEVSESDRSARKRVETRPARAD
ncbi:UPF0175 family protein [Halopenitus salinus]|jgi:predicted HTH domain antitoxin|uniref:UPF0175 family protein n=1 Tax=Halopenitus salinus TaxID=1198295 RepID=A0ABD5UU80_9EURY